MGTPWKTALLLCLTLCACSGADEGSPVEPREHPNIVLIFVDDLGYADLGVQGSADILTPHIDRLAGEGVRFTSGYVTAPQCSPARAGILTGRNQSRFGYEMNARADYSVSEEEHLAGKPLPGLPVGEITIADRLKAAGYATGIIGKWHLGEEEEFHPLNRGFDEFYGFLKGGIRYLPIKNAPVLERNGEMEVCGEYLTDALSDEAAAFIDRHKEEPFFLYLSYNCPHTPMQAKPVDLERFEEIEDPTRRALAAMMYSLDEGVGEVMAALARAEIEQDTLVFFISDNGGQTNKNASLNSPFSGAKGDLLEGGIRIPYIARWTGEIPVGVTLDAPVSSLDVCATAVALAGLPAASELEGLDLLPYMRGEGSLARSTLYWRFGEQRALRRGDWKYFSYTEEVTLLFDLSTDPSERHNLASEQPELVRELREAYADWEGGLMDPLWASGANQPQRVKALKREHGLKLGAAKESK